MGNGTLSTCLRQEAADGLVFVHIRIIDRVRVVPFWVPQMLGAVL